MYTYLYTFIYLNIFIFKRYISFLSDQPINQFHNLIIHQIVAILYSIMSLNNRVIALNNSV